MAFPSGNSVGQDPILGNEDGKSQFENGPTSSGTLQAGVPAMNLENLLADGKSKANSILFSVADERLEQFLADGRGHPRAIVHKANLDTVLALTEAHFNFAGLRRHSLAGVQQQVRKNSLHFLLVKPSLAPAFAGDRNVYAVKFRACPNRMDGALQRFLDPAEYSPERFSCLRKFQQGIDEIRHLIDGRADLSIKFFALARIEAFLAKKLRVGNDCCERMPQIVRNGAGHAADGYKPLSA